MNNYQISVNQLADFSGSTEYGKKRIIAQQRLPDRFRIPWYQLSKARVKKSIELRGDLEPIYDGIQTLMNRKPVNKRQETDKRVSIEALERYVKMQLPKMLLEVDFTVIKAKVKSLTISNVEVIVAPEIIVKGKLKGKTIIGAVKIHVSKSNPFDLKKSKLVASTIFQYLEKEFANDDVTVIPELCCCLDIFSGRIVSAQQTDSSVYKEVEEICNEIKRLSEAA